MTDDTRLWLVRVSRSGSDHAKAWLYLVKAEDERMAKLKVGDHGLATYEVKYVSPFASVALLGYSSWGVREEVEETKP